jgi:hypothetical protein
MAGKIDGLAMGNGHAHAGADAETLDAHRIVLVMGLDGGRRDPDGSGSQGQ